MEKIKDIFQKHTIPFLDIAYLMLHNEGYPDNSLDVPLETVKAIMPSTQRRNFDALNTIHKDIITSLLNIGKDCFWCPNLKTGYFEVVVASDEESFKQHLSEQWEIATKLGMTFDDFYSALRIDFVKEGDIKINPDEVQNNQF